MSKQLRVLLVEDNEDDVLLLVRHLTKSGYEITYQQVQTESEMRQALEDMDWDVVLADYAMPHFSGPQALAAFKSYNLEIPFIVISGTIGEENAVALMRCGAHDYLMKDNIIRLVPAIERELEETKHRTEKKHAQQIVKEQRDFLEKILDSMPNPLYVVDANTYIIKISNKAAKKENIIPEGKKCYEYLYKSPKKCDDNENACPITRIKETKKTVSLTHRHKDENGVEKYYELKGFPIFNGDNKVSKVIIYFVDITKEVNVGENIKQIQQELEEAQKLAICGQIAAEIGHEIANPLTFVSVRLQQMMSKSFDNREKLEEIITHIDRIKKLLKDFSNIGRKTDLVFEDADLAPIIDSVISLVNNTKRLGNVSISKEVAADLPKIRINKNKIIQVILNLLINAIDACYPEGEVVVSAELLDMETDNGMEKFVKISVRDNGHGMTEDQKKKVFEPFFTTKEKDRGLGLGLPVSQSIVQQHQGWMDIQSSLDEGTCFSFFLPIEKVAEEVKG